MRIAGRRSVRRAVLNRVDRTARPHRPDEDLLERALPLVADGVNAVVAAVFAAPAVGWCDLDEAARGQGLFAR